MIRARKYRLYPTPNQEQVLIAWMSTCKHLWNCSLLDRKTAWEEREENISFYDQCKQLTKSRAQYPELAAIPLKFARGTLQNLDLAFKSFFRRCKSGDAAKGYPRRKKLNNSIITRDAGGKSWWVDGYISVPKLGKVNARPKVAPGLQVKVACIKVIAGKWYCTLAGENGISVPALVPAMKCVGIDLGCSSLITTSDGEHVAPPKYYRHAQEKRQKLARRMAKKKLGSANWRKAKKQLASLEHDVANARETFLHTLSRRLVDEYDLIAMEEDIAKGLIENDKATTGITKSITDAGWGELVRMIEYKCEELGKHFVQVPARGTTQECSGCGKVVPKKLWDRVHSCPHCGLILDRDENAALNILQRAIGLAEAA